MKQLAKGICSICCVYFFQLSGACAQELADTVRLDIKQAEKVFLDSNLQLLAAHYNVNSAQALVEQARKWDNPMLITDQNIYANKQWLAHGKDGAGNEQGQVFVQVQQLIKTAGKRGKQVALAMTNVNIAEWQFKGTMRDLRATLFRDFYTVAQLQGRAALYDENMVRMQKLMAAQEVQLKAGNIARKEYLRVQALILGLQHDMMMNAKDLNDAEAELKTLLRITGNKFIQPVTTEAEAGELPTAGIAGLVDSARHNNSDYQQQVYQYQYSQQNLRLQRALAVPDVSVGPEYDQASNYTPNYVGLTLSLPLPLLDRNQGNIKSAGWQVKQDDALLHAADEKLQNDVMNAYQKLLYTIKLTSNNNTQFYKDYYQLQKNIADSYDNRQISLVEFLEYFNDYKEIREKQLDALLELRLAKQNLNDVVGVDVAL